MNFKNVKVPNLPGGGAIGTLIKLGVIGGLGLYGAANSLYNVDGGHRAIMFNRIVGVKDKVNFLTVAYTKNCVKLMMVVYFACCQI
jgi:prohibitin 2